MPKKTTFYDTRPKPERAVIIAVYPSYVDSEKVDEYLKEQKQLVSSVDAVIVNTFIQRLEKPINSTYLGSGKLNQVKNYIKENDITLALFEDDLSPSQIKNLNKELKCRIVDKSMLILDIFALRARTIQAKTQVELAQLQYMLPRLTRMWTHLERQKGGIGQRGPGETQIESDRRMITNRISLLRKKLVSIKKQNTNQQKRRNLLPRLALVGYTNAGKSSLLNTLSKSKVYVEDKLFATLDTTVRKTVINDQAFLLSDTVGFIRKLPHILVESFHSTLEEAKQSDLIIHVIDVSNESMYDHINVVDKTLQEIGASTIHRIIVFNKMDILETDIEHCPDKTNDYIEYTKKSTAEKFDYPVFFISALKKESLNELKNYISDYLKDKTRY